MMYKNNVVLFSVTYGMYIRFELIMRKWYLQKVAVSYI